MKPHIVIILLVVCVATPLVALGMFYLCESMPIIEVARAREQEGMAQRQSYRIEEEQEEAPRRTRNQSADELADVPRQTRNQSRVELADATNSGGHSTSPMAGFKDDGMHVAIKGVSINLPYERLKQELAAKFGGIKESGKDTVADIRSCVDYGGVLFDFDQVGDLEFKNAFPFFDSSLFALHYESPGKSKPETRVILPEYTEGKKFLWGVWEYTKFKDETAFGGKVILCQGERREGCYFVAVVFSSDDGAGKKYEESLQNKYGNRNNGNSYREPHMRIMEDGIIVTLNKTSTDVPELTFFFYFNKSTRDAYLRNKATYERNAKERKEREESERKEAEKKEAERVKLRDAGGI